MRARRRLAAAGTVPWFALLCALAAPAGAYEGSLHQELTFIAAKQFNHCAAQVALPRLTPLQVRYIAKANVRQTESNIFRKATRWTYYNREEQRPRSMLWFIQTRLHQHFNRLVEEVGAAEALAERYSGLGRIVNYVQDVTSPPHVVPVFTARLWRWDISDRFDRYPVDVDAVSAALGDACTDFKADVDGYQGVLAVAADRTLAAVREQIPGLPVSWQVFWRIGADGGFGSYGGAGNNFGRPAEFECGGTSRAERCVLLDRDPLYAAFATERHLDAVRATITAMWMLQHGLPGLSSMGARAE